MMEHNIYAPFIDFELKLMCHANLERIHNLPKRSEDLKENHPLSPTDSPHSVHQGPIAAAHVHFQTHGIVGLFRLR